MVLSLIHASRDAGISQSEVVQKTGLKAPTIFRIFTSLEEEGLIVPAQGNAEEIVAKKGRRPVLYVVSKHARYTIGLEFWTAFLSLGVFDFQGERIYSVMHPLSESVQAGQVIDLIVDEIHRILDELSIPKQKIIGVGVAAPGQVDLARKRVRYYPRIEGMKDIALVDELSAARTCGNDPQQLQRPCFQRVPLRRIRPPGQHVHLPAQDRREWCLRA
jgi:hypothetical protein